LTLLVQPLGPSPLAARLAVITLVPGLLSVMRDLKLLGGGR